MDVVRVLLVDDQPAFLRAMAAVIEETRGFVAVGVAASGEECLLLAEELRPDLVLLDVNLPGIDGVETAQRLGRQDLPPAVVLLSTYDEDAGARFIVDCGAAAYVTKSAFGPDRLREAWTAATT